MTEAVGTSSRLRLPRLTALVVLSFATLCAAQAKPFGPGEAASRAKAAERTDFKVVVWYRLTDPLGTFKFEIYDVRKGEYTAEVDQWIKDVRVRFPGHYVALRGVDLTREKGATELLKVGKVIDREVAIAASRAGIVIGPSRIDSRPDGYGTFGRAPTTGSNRNAGLGRSRTSPSFDRDYLKQSTTPFPIPIPILTRPR